MLNFTRPYVITIQRVKKGNLIVLWVVLGPSKAGTSFLLKPGFHQRRKHNQKEHAQIQQRINHLYLS